MIRIWISAALAGVLLLGAPQATMAGEADVLGAKATQSAPGVWRFSVTVKHADTGWKHYADKWDVVGPDGKVLGTRVLLHPHETEQPFTRSLTNVRIPPNVSEVTIRAHDNVHKYGGKEITVKLP